MNFGRFLKNQQRPVIITGLVRANCEKQVAQAEDQSSAGRSLAASVERLLIIVERSEPEHRNNVEHRIHICVNQVHLMRLGACQCSNRSPLRSRARFRLIDYSTHAIENALLGRFSCLLPKPIIKREPIA